MGELGYPWYEWTLPALVVATYAGWGVCRFVRGRR
jgi:hypothetical protein